MIRSWHNRGTEDVFNGKQSKAARGVCPSNLFKVARRKLIQLAAATEIGDMRIPPKNLLEKLSGNRKGQWSVRINIQYRVCFRWEDGHAHDVEIVDYH